jgi:hypothetical protein
LEGDVSARAAVCVGCVCVGGGGAGGGGGRAPLAQMGQMMTSVSLFLASGHWWAAYVRCSRQNVRLQQSQLNGRKSICRQVSTAQWRPIPMRSLSSELAILSAVLRAGREKIG